MSLTTPIVPQTIIPFPATENYNFVFNSIGGSQVFANELEIRNNSNDTQVYLEKITTFQFIHTIPSNTLINGIEYKARIRTFDINDNASQWSDWVIFLCLSVPSVDITNIINGIVNNQTYVFEGSYNQSENEELQSYRFLLYSENNVLLQSYPEKFGLPISQEVAGLQNDTNYRIELRIITVNGMEATTGLIPFLAQYIQPQLANVITLENFEQQASIRVSANVIEIYGEIGSGTIEYENDDWINLHNGMIYFQEGVNFLNNNFTFYIWVKDIITDESFIKFIGQNGRIELKLQDDGRIHVYKTITIGGTPYHTASEEIIEPEVGDEIFIFFQHINNYCNIQTEILS